VIVGAPDEEWLERKDTPGAQLQLLTEPYTPILPNEIEGITAILTGGHFPGSLLLHSDKGILFNADTFFTSPSGTNPVPGKPGVISFSFFWSIPNRIPLHPDDILKIWNLVKGLDFHTCIGAFKGQDVRTQPNEKERGTGGVKGRLLESAKIYVGAMGYKEDQHALFAEKV
jgi:glyoxylase-like metal-dependent hydrolase (beta-lactamase superfamily II)